MALIGAITRLTESGLSIVEWKPVTGALPPLSAETWEHEFFLYQQSPQYLKVNHGMTLAEFKGIYFWEWLHRLWGRLIGVIYFIPLVYFMAHGKINTAIKPAIFATLGLGFLQGAMGWYMVKSGLVDQPAVSHYRLAAHLMLALAIYALLFRTGLALTIPSRKTGFLKLKKLTMIALGLAVITMTWGAFTAGLRAGLLYNTFPLMNGHWLPPELAAHQSVWRSFFEEPAVVQFAHRILALLTFLKIMMLWRKSVAFSCPLRLKRLFTALGVMALLQVFLGIATLLTQVNMMLAVLHQAGAFVLVTLLLWIRHEVK